MRPRLAQRWNAAIRLLAVAVWLVAALVFVAGAATARADVDPVAAEYAERNAGRICQTLDAYPTPVGVMGIGDAIVDEGYLSWYQAGQAIALSVLWVCPEHQPVMEEFLGYGRRAI